MLDDPFSLLPPTALQTKVIKQGDAVFRQDQQATGLYRVIEGCVTLQRTGQGGDTLTLHRASLGGYFAEASIFSKTYHCDAFCTERGRVLKIAKAQVVTMMQTNTDFAEGFARLLAAQVQSNRGTIEILAIRSAKDRVFAAIQAGYLQGSIFQFAGRINLTHEACYRALRSLCHDHLIVKTGRGQYRLAHKPSEP